MKRGHLVNPMGRSCPEWIGATLDSKIPQSVYLRVYLRSGGICALSGRKVGPGEWDLDHIKALADGGEHRESNLQVAWRPKHIEKTAAENSDRDKADRIWAKYNSVYPKSKHPLRSRRFESSRHVNGTTTARRNRAQDAGQ